MAGPRIWPAVRGKTIAWIEAAPDAEGEQFDSLNGVRITFTDGSVLRLIVGTNDDVDAWIHHEYESAPRKKVAKSAVKKKR